MARTIAGILVGIVIAVALVFAIEAIVGLIVPARSRPGALATNR